VPIDIKLSTLERVRVVHMRTIGCERTCQTGHGTMYDGWRSISLQLNVLCKHTPTKEFKSDRDPHYGAATVAIDLFKSLGMYPGVSRLSNSARARIHLPSLPPLIVSDSVALLARVRNRPGLPSGDWTRARRSIASFLKRIQRICVRVLYRQ
jgi:hypothetical protein